MKVGITGTRNGCRDEQLAALVTLIKELKPTEFHHGDCIGVDDQAATIADELEPRPVVVCHPPSDEKLRAFNKSFNQMRDAKTHFARNRDIVNETECLIVCPMKMHHENWGGTWYTHDYSKKQGKKIYICWPDGTVS